MLGKGGGRWIVTIFKRLVLFKFLFLIYFSPCTKFNWRNKNFKKGPTFFFIYYIYLVTFTIRNSYQSNKYPK